MSQVNRFVRAFRRDVMNASPHGRDHYVRLYWSDRAAFEAAMWAAWDSWQPEPYVTLAQVQALNEDIGAKAAHRLCRRLFAAQRFEEAAEVLMDPRYGLGLQADGQLALAQAQLGLGRLHEASAAIARAGELDAAMKGPGAQLGSVVEKIGAAEAAARGARAWPALQTLVEHWIEVGALGAALRALMDPALLPAQLDGVEPFEFHTLLDTILSMHRPASAHNLFRALVARAASGKDRLDREMVADSLSDRAPTTLPAPAPFVGAKRMTRTSAALAWAQAGQLEAAIDTLGGLSLDFPKAPEPRAALARAVGQYVLRSHPLRLGPSAPRKVIDVFPFNSELRLLDLKLSEMAGWVDHFVIVEARQTFTGAPKPLVFQENRAAFSAFDSKIVHVVVDAFPPHVRHPWSREFYQRDMGVLGLDGVCGEDDVVLITDADELISREAVERFERGRQNGFARLAMERARYFLNYREALAPEDHKDASSVWRGRYLAALGLSYARNVMRWDKKAPRLTAAGWHFTSIGGAREIAAKLSNSAHQEHAAATSEGIEAALSEIRAGRLEPGWERCELDERFPAYLRAHPQRFGDLLI